MPDDILNDKPNADNVVSFKSTKCPKCKSNSIFEYRPFCSNRCANLDLGNWLNESYSIQSDEQNDLDESSMSDD